MKQLSAILSIAVLVLLFQVAHISVCYSADNAADPNIAATADSGSDMIASTVSAPQVAASAADSSQALIIRIPLHEGMTALIGIIVLIGLALAAIYIRRTYKVRNAAIDNDTKTPAHMEFDDVTARTGREMTASSTEAASRPAQQTDIHDQAYHAATDETKPEAMPNGHDRETEMSSAAATTSANTPYSEYLKGGGPDKADTSEAPKTAKHAYLSTAAGDDNATLDDQTTAPAIQQDLTTAAETEKKNGKSTQGVEAIAETVSASDRDLIDRLEAFVSTQMHNVDLSVDDIAGAMCMSRSTLFRRVKQLYGINPNEYLRQRRLSYAAELLQQNKYTISDICLLVGFNSPSYFSSCFKKQYNVLPKNYRAR